MFRLVLWVLKVSQRLFLSSCVSNAHTVARRVETRLSAKMTDNQKHAMIFLRRHNNGWLSRIIIEVLLSSVLIEWERQWIICLYLLMNSLLSYVFQINSKALVFSTKYWEWDKGAGKVRGQWIESDHTRWSLVPDNDLGMFDYSRLR